MPTTGTPLRTVAYLVFYTLVAALAFGWFTHVSSCQWPLVVAASVAAVSLGVGLPIRVTVEPMPWRRLCRARNVALSAALVFCLVDLVDLIWFLAAVSHWQR